MTKQILNIIFLLLFSECLYAQVSSICTNNEKEILIKKIEKATLEYESEFKISFNSKKHDLFSDTTLIFVKEYVASPIKKLEGYDYTKNILDYIVIQENNFTVNFFKKNKCNYEVISSTSCNKGECGSLSLEKDHFLNALDPVLKNVKNIDKITVFGISFIFEIFVLVNDELFVIKDGKLIEALPYLKENYTLDYLKGRYYK